MRGLLEQDLDPEVVADLQLRDASLHDKTRTRRSAESLANVTVSPTVANWNCRHPACFVLVAVTPEAVEALATSNRLLAARGEREIPDNAIVVCDEHRRELREHKEQRNSANRIEMARLIQQIKLSPSPRNEHDLIRKLSDLHHPDVKGLLDCLEDKLRGNRGARKAKP